MPSVGLTLILNPNPNPNPYPHPYPHPHQVMPPVGGPVKGSAVVSTGQGGAPNAEGKNPWETGEPGHWGDDGEWVSEVGGAGGQAAPEAAGQAAPEAALQAAPEEAVPPAKLALSCEATSPQASADWCVTSCGEDPENNGCKQFCKCEAMGETSEASEASSRRWRQKRRFASSLLMNHGLHAIDACTRPAD